MDFKINEPSKNEICMLNDDFEKFLDKYNLPDLSAVNGYHYTIYNGFTIKSLTSTQLDF